MGTDGFLRLAYVMNESCVRGRVSKSRKSWMMLNLDVNVELDGLHDALKNRADLTKCQWNDS